MTTHIANFASQFCFIMFTLFLSATVTPALGQESQPLSESLELELALDDKDPTPECLQKHSAIACTPLRVTIANHADRGIGYVSSSCAHPRPFEFEFLNAGRKEWHDVLLLRDMNDITRCSENFVEWVVIPPRGSLSFHTTLAEGFSPLDVEKMEKHLPLTVRTKWDGGACLAAGKEELKDESTLAFMHCSPGSPYEHAVSVRSNSLVLNQPATLALRPAA